MNSTINQAINRQGLIIVISIMQDPEENKNNKNNEPDYQNPFMIQIQIRAHRNMTRKRIH